MSGLPPRLQVGTLVLADCQTLYYGCQGQFGQKSRTDFKSLIAIIGERVAEANAAKGPVIAPGEDFTDYRAYVFHYAGADLSRLMGAMRAFGWMVYPGPYSGTGSWTAHLALEAHNSQGRYDRFVFVSGDGVLVKTVETLKANGKEVWAVAFPYNFNGHPDRPNGLGRPGEVDSLYCTVDKAIGLSGDVVYAPWRTKDAGR